ncbi:MAG: hypothetical protein AB7W16_04855 [Candidatus Obscuribacterales bacterium]
MKREPFIRRCRLYLSLALAALCMTVLAESSFAIDQMICGQWRTYIRRPNATLTIDWHIEPSGRYTVTSSGPGGKQTESGTISTRGGSYSKTTNIGPDNGTYQVINPDKFVTDGRFGHIEWTRVAGGVAKAPVSTFVPPTYGNSGNTRSNYQQVPASQGYNPDFNPRSKAWENMGYGKACTTRDQSGWTPGNNAPVAALQGADLKTLLFSNFPLKGGSDEAEQFALPELAKAAAGGMRKRDFRLQY